MRARQHMFQIGSKQPDANSENGFEASVWELAEMVQAPCALSRAREKPVRLPRMGACVW